jgi:hypothetical protein
MAVLNEAGCVFGATAIRRIGPRFVNRGRAVFKTKEMKEMDANSNSATEIFPQKFNQKDLESVRITAITTSGSYAAPLS